MGSERLSWGLKGLIWGLRGLIWRLRGLIWGLRSLIWGLRGLIWGLTACLEAKGGRENHPVWNHKSSAPPGPLPKSIKATKTPVALIIELTIHHSALCSA